MGNGERGTGSSAEAAQRAEQPKDETATPAGAASPYEHLFTALRYETSRGPLNPFGTLYRFFLYQWDLINKMSLAPRASTGSSTELTAEQSTASNVGSPYREARWPKPPNHLQTSPVPLLVLVVVSFSLTLMEYYGSSRDLQAFLKWLSTSKDAGWADWAKGITGGNYRELYGFIYWSMARFVGYMVIPCIATWLFLRGERVTSYGLSFKSAQSHTRLYVTLYMMIAPVVFLVSFTAGFQKTYPFYSLASRSWLDFLVFELFYGFQFFTLEFFFRGFILHSLKRYVGAYAIFFMIVPYCMIHFGKPMPETLGAIGAGLILGTISLRTNSIWGGFGIHVAVAISMDLSSLWQKGLL